MTIMPITDKTPKCFGICCALHARCARYLDVDGMRSSSDLVIATCSTGGDDRPLFLAVEEEEQ